MNLWHIEFDELYERHLCRHSQFGVNVVHLLSLIGTWFGVYGFVYWLFPENGVVIGMAAAYFAVLTPFTPLGVLLPTAMLLAAFVAGVIWAPVLPFWVYLLMIPVFYMLQNWSHKWFTVETDMTEFNKKYRKGRVLFIILLFYEIPIIVNFLLFRNESESGGDTGDGLLQATTVVDSET